MTNADHAELRRAVQELLELVREGEPSDANRKHLALLLDRLALLMHFVDCEFDSSEYPHPPEWDYEERRRLVAKAFPDFGFYNAPLHIVSQIGTSECGVGDAVDDLADIAGDLNKADWRWSNTSVNDALWHLVLDYRAHWRQHLRGLQVYLAACESEERTEGPGHV